MLELMRKLKRKENSVAEMVSILKRIEERAKQIMEEAEERENRLAAKTVVQYCYSVIEGLRNSDIGEEHQGEICKKLTGYIKKMVNGAKEKATPLTMEMLQKIGDHTKKKARAGNFCNLLPVLCVFQNPHSLANFEAHGIDAFYYGEYEDYGSNTIVIQDQLIAIGDQIQAKDGYEIFQSKRTPLGMVFWLTKKETTPMLQKAIGHMLEWGFPWA